ncbi:MAG TPA: diacylglycerol kinase [Allosphingosinicella sp.]|jgi:diacylglycerol kinase (ATP)
MRGSDPGEMKNRRFAARLRFAVAGLRLVFRREKSFRAQCAFALAAALATLVWRPGPLWAALVALSIVLVLALELVNSALEYLLDRLHPAFDREIGAAKDAAAAAVLLASLAAALVGALMLLSVLPTAA